MMDKNVLKIDKIIKNKQKEPSDIDFRFRIFKFSTFLIAQI